MAGEKKITQGIISKEEFKKAFGILDNCRNSKNILMENFLYLKQHNPKLAVKIKEIFADMDRLKWTN